MSNQLSEDVMMSGQPLDGTILGSWVDLFGPIDYTLLYNVNTTNPE
jgi:hypothetical protein